MKYRITKMIRVGAVYKSNLQLKLLTISEYETQRFVHRTQNGQTTRSKHFPPQDSAVQQKEPHHGTFAEEKL